MGARFSRGRVDPEHDDLRLVAERRLPRKAAGPNWCGQWPRAYRELPAARGPSPVALRRPVDPRRSAKSRPSGRSTIDCRSAIPPPQALARRQVRQSMARLPGCSTKIRADGSSERGAGSGEPPGGYPAGRSGLPAPCSLLPAFARNQTIFPCKSMQITFPASTTTNRLPAKDAWHSLDTFSGSAISRIGRVARTSPVSGFNSTRQSIDGSPAPPGRGPPAAQGEHEEPPVEPERIGGRRPATIGQPEPLTRLGIEAEHADPVGPRGARG